MMSNLRIDTSKLDQSNQIRGSSIDMINIASLSEMEFPSAKIKLNELFLEWLSLDTTKRMVELVLEDTTAHANDLPESGRLASLSLQNLPYAPDRGVGSQPPRSPTKKSPKKRTQAEMQNNNVSTNVPTGFSRNSKTSLVNRTDVVTGTGDVDTETDYSVSASRRPRSNFDSIPIFYKPGNIHPRTQSRRVLEDQLSVKQAEIETFFKPYPNGVSVDKFVHITKRLCGIPSFFNLPLCKRIFQYFNVDDNTSGNTSISPSLSSSTGTKSTLNSLNSSGNMNISDSSKIKIKLKTFLYFWKNEIEPFDRYERFFRVVKQYDSEYIYKDDFVPFLQELLHFHPGLDFLEAHDEFQRKYALTVIARIFFKVNISRTGRISLREVRQSNLVEEFMHVDEETDINRVTEYFSYEHFYVLYCRFFELDTDKDSKISRDDLLKYGEHALSESIIDRVFHVSVRAFGGHGEKDKDASIPPTQNNYSSSLNSSLEKGSMSSFRKSGMSYADFIYFMLAEEDKGSLASLSYWFQCCDLDGDGKLTPDEMRYFYRSQLHRMTSLGQEAVKFADVLCQMIDMLDPGDKCALTLHDMCRPEKVQLSGLLFDVLFNLHKFIRFETRDPFQDKQRREDVHGNDWNRFAAAEYHRLAAEEEGYDGGNSTGTMDVDVDRSESKLSMRDGDEDHRDGDDGGSGRNSGWYLDDEDDDDSSFRSRGGSVAASKAD